MYLNYKNFDKDFSDRQHDISITTRESFRVSISRICALNSWWSQELWSTMKATVDYSGVWIFPTIIILYFFKKCNILNKYSNKKNTNENGLDNNLRWIRTEWWSLDF